MNREIIYAALFNKLRDIPGLVTTSRRLQLWSDVSSEKQPALFQAQRGEVAAQTKGLPTKWTLQADLYLYIHCGNDPDATPATALNNLLDAIEAALKPDSSGCQTLGGLVSHCWIAGRIETDEGTLGPQAVAIIPIEILTA